jgi:hypothetical protein
VTSKAGDNVSSARRRPEPIVAAGQAAWDYTERVVRLIAAATLAAFTLLVSMDKICCPDGCTDSGGEPVSTQSVPHNPAHTCVLCVLGVEAATVEFSLKPLADVSIVPAAIIAWLPVGAPLPLDHPPRTA